MKSNEEKAPKKKSQETTTGEKKVSRSRKKKEATVNESEAEADSKEKKKEKLSPENSLVFVSCLNDDFKKKLKDLAKVEGVEVINLEDRIVTDYLRIHGSKDKGALKQFVEESSTRVHAEKQCKKLYNIMTHNGTLEIFIFNRTEVVKSTTLSHAKALQLLKLFETFGLIKWTKKDYEFQFIFDKDVSRIILEADVDGLCSRLNDCIVRYNELVNSDDNLDSKKKKDKKKEFIELINEKIEFE